MVIAVDSISFQLPVTQLPVSDIRVVLFELLLLLLIAGLQVDRVELFVHKIIAVRGVEEVDVLGGEGGIGRALWRIEAAVLGEGRGWQRLVRAHSRVDVVVAGAGGAVGLAPRVLLELLLRVDGGGLLRVDGELEGGQRVHGGVEGRAGRGDVGRGGRGLDRGEVGGGVAAEAQVLWREATRRD